MPGGVVDRGLDVAVMTSRLVQGVADSSHADAACHCDRADHVQDDPGLAFGVPSELALRDDIEKIVRSEGLIRGRIEVIRCRVMLDVAESGSVLSRKRVVRTVGERGRCEQRMGGATATEVDLECVRSPAVPVLDRSEVHAGATDDSLARQPTSDLQRLAAMRSAYS